MMVAMKRSYIRRKPRRNRTLTAADWVELQTQVQRRDATMSAAKLRERLDPLTAARMASQGDLPCVAWIISGGPITCAGPWHLEHVKDDYRMGVKAEDDPEHLLNLCATHDERGMQAGFQWNTNSQNRILMRQYLAEVNA
jgi:hypothetical protein